MNPLMRLTFSLDKTKGPIYKGASHHELKNTGFQTVDDENL